MNPLSSLVEMGACISEDLTLEQPEETPVSIAERQRSLVEFVRALSEPTVMRGRSSFESDCKHKSVPISKQTSPEPVQSIDELTPQQEAFISGFKMQVYGQKGDYVRQASTFEYIESEFLNKYHKPVSRSVLYSIFNIH